ncbi:hypothetical protein MNBD_CHLOROFLEXI01-326 [hydrothermal vent metagenome]|uniref:Uncharacterized protein n=1 Tax=hydrothermal vent metagenome TaxID=652676 RepID=A0A3B0VGQ6_9ZZZZ
MQTVTNQPQEETDLTKAKRVYAVFTVTMTILILAIFFEPTVSRLFEGIWQRQEVVFVWTFSLDVHATLGFLFIFMFILQFFFGYQQSKWPQLKRYHRRLGSAMFYVVIPLFILADIWVVIHRSTAIAPEQSVVFGQDRLMVVILILEILLFMAWYIIRSFQAVKQKDYPSHLDNIFAAYMMAGGIALFRFLFAILWATFGTSPISFVGVFFVTCALTLMLLILAFSLVGRLKQNRFPLFVFVIANVLVAILGAGNYSIINEAFIN